MRTIANVPREAVVAVLGSVWLAEDIGGRLVEHLGCGRPALHFGDVFATKEEALAARPHYEVVPLGQRISLPNLTPIPHRGRKAGAINEVFVFAFDDLMEKGLRVETAAIHKVEFDVPPPHLMGKVDFVATAVIAGENPKYRIRLQYDASFGANIVENPQVYGTRGYETTEQAMAFFKEEDAHAAADALASDLIKAADWRSRTHDKPLVAGAEAIVEHAVPACGR